MTDANGVRDHQHTLLRLLREISTPRMAEIGVASGNTSEYLLRNHASLRLVMVDHWTAPKDNHRRGQDYYNAAYTQALQRTSFAADRRWLCRNRSADEARKHINFGYNLVFIDACHVHEFVLADIAAWWPTLAINGILCGHDIDSDKDYRGVWGVRRAVEQFCRLLPVTFTVEKNVWIIRKPY